MKPVKVLIQKATLVPTKQALVNLYRTDWKKVRKIDYGESPHIFKKVNENGKGLGIETDAQLAKWLVDNFGLGRYHIKIWQKGTPGFTFINIDCREKERFRQVPKKKSSKSEMLRKYKLFQKQLQEVKDDPVEAQQIQEKIDEIADDVRVQNELEDYAGKEGNHGHYRKIHLVKNTKTLYKPHEYQEYGVSKDKDNKSVTIKKYDSRLI